MTIIDFYKSLSKLLTDTREGFTSREDGQAILDSLLSEAKKSKLSVNIDPNILEPINLMRLDDEKSFANEDDDFSFDAGSDYESSYT